MLQLRRAKPQRQLFEEEEEVPAVPVRVQLPLSVQEQLRQAQCRGENPPPSHQYR